jgi:hypothetical protein
MYAQLLLANYFRAGSYAQLILANFSIVCLYAQLILAVLFCHSDRALL